MKNKILFLGIFTLLVLFKSYAFDSTNKIKKEKKSLSTFCENQQEVQAAILNNDSEIILKNGVYRDFNVVFTNSATPFTSNIIFRAETAGKVVFTGKSKIRVTGTGHTLSGFVFFNVKEEDAKYASIHEYVDHQAKDINGNNIVMNHRILLLFNASSCTIKDIAFIDCGKPQFPIDVQYEEYLNGGAIIKIHKNGLNDNNIIENCYWDGSLYISFIMSYLPSTEEANSGNIFQNNYAKDINEWYGVNATPFTFGLTHHPYGDGHNTKNIIQNNLFENVSSDREIIAVKFSDTEILNNTFINNMETTDAIGHLSIRSGNNSIVKGNFFLGTMGGVRIFGDNHKIYNNYFDTKDWGIAILGGQESMGSTINHVKANNCTIANNTFSNTCKPLLLGTGWDGASTYSTGENTFTNNIFYIEKEPTNTLCPLFCCESSMNFIDYDLLMRYASSPENIIFNNNIAYTNSSTVLNKFNTFKNDYNIDDTQIKFQNPDFETINGINKLKSTSPMIDLGIPTDIILNDIDGQVRIGNLDVGADEYSTSPITNEPLDPIDVGPSWITNSSTYEDFNNEVLDWKRWDLYDPIAGGNPAFIRMPNFNSGNSILQFDLTEAEGFEYYYNPTINRYVFTCEDNRPRRVSVSVQDFNEKPIYNIDNSTETANLENWIVKLVSCENFSTTYIEITGNGEEAQFSNSLDLSMTLFDASYNEITNFDTESDYFLNLGVTYFVRLENPLLSCLFAREIQYIIKPNPNSFTIANRFNKEINSEKISIFPNPFTNKVTIKVNLKKEYNITITITDAFGKEIKQFKNNDNKLTKEFVWNGLDKFKNRVSKGYYFCKIQIGGDRTIYRKIFFDKK